MAVFEVIGLDNCRRPSSEIAATRGNKEIIKLLLERGADVNHCKAFDETALHFACQAAPIIKLRSTSSLRKVLIFGRRIKLGGRALITPQRARTCKGNVYFSFATP